MANALQDGGVDKVGFQFQNYLHGGIQWNSNGMMEFDNSLRAETLITYSISIRKRRYVAMLLLY